MAEFDASGNQIKSYGYRPGSTWTTDPLFMEQGGQYYFYHNDHLGTPQQMTSVSGAVVWAAEYGAFGQAQVDGTSSVVNNLRFPGQYYDGETGLCYNWNRYYDSGSGRYLEKDPIGYENGLNLYTYTGNNPISLIDPQGLSTITDVISVLPVVGTIYNALTDPLGSKVSDYSISVNCDDLNACRLTVSQQAATYLINYHRLHLAHGFIDTVGTGVALSTGNIPLAIVVAVDGVADLAISFHKSNKIRDAAKEAGKLCDKKYEDVCKCNL